MWKSIFIFASLTSVCYCQNFSLGGYHHHKKPYHDPYYELLYGGGILYYLAFIAIKIKVAFVIGTIITVFIVAGKVLALVKYAEYMKSSHHESVPYHAPAVEHFSPHYSPGPDKSYFGPGANSGQYYDSPPPGPDQSNFGYNSPPPGPDQSNFGYDSPPPGVHGRSLGGLDELFVRMLRKFNGTDTAFEELGVKSVECRKKVICKAEYISRASTTVNQILHIFRDEAYDRYKPTSKIKSWGDCDRLYQNCE